ncbi:MAG: gluzincin family metallopeptidase [Planctomycetota bacterium]|jgi:hypothetical protein
MLDKRLKISATAAILVAGGLLAAPQGNLEVLDVKIDPIRRGKNVVHTQVRNTSPEDQIFAIHIQTRCPYIGGWGTSFTDTMEAGETKWVRHACKIRGFITDDTWIRLQFYNPSSVDEFDFEDWFERKRYFANDLEQYKTDESELKPASESQAKAVTEVLRHLQNYIKSQDYQAAWDLFTQDFREAEFQIRGFERFKKSMESPQRHYLSGNELLALEPKDVNRRNDVLALTATMKDGPWVVDFVKVEDKWKIDSIGPVGAALEPVGTEVPEQAIVKAFQEFQSHLKDGKYEAVWDLLSRDSNIRSQYEGDCQEFKEVLSSDDAKTVSTLWGNLHPESVVKSSEFLVVLNARSENQTWKWYFVNEAGQWKIHAAQVDRENWQEKLLPSMQTRNTKHFDIYYFKDSTAEKEIDQVAEQKAKGFEEICRFLGKESDMRIRMVFFEDGQTKQMMTGHQGAGWAFGNTIVEIYNEKEKLDPYHETVHVLMRSNGNPPALFNEGFAVYMSERLGSHALDDLGGSQATIYERVKELKEKGELIDLRELLGYTEIGSGKTNPPVAYPEAASFVKFLIDQYGKDKFLQTYRTLENSADKTTQQENIRTLEQIYGASLAELEKHWEKAFSS